MPVSTGPEGNVRVYAKRDADTEPRASPFVHMTTPRSYDTLRSASYSALFFSLAQRHTIVKRCFFNIDNFFGYFPAAVWLYMTTFIIFPR